MKAFLSALFMVCIVIFQTYGQAKVTFAAPTKYKLKVVIGSQTQEDEQYVRFETMAAGDHIAKITVTANGEVYSMQSNVSLPANRETSYFVIVVNKTAQIHWTNEAALATPEPVASRERAPVDYGREGNDWNTQPAPRYDRRPSYPNGNEYDYKSSERRATPAMVRCNCSNPYPVLTPLEATRLKAAVQQTSFDDDRMALIHTALMRANVMTNDVQDLMRLLSFDNNRLKLAKRVYDHTCDRQNYYLLTSAFDFSSNARELQRYLQYYR